MGKSKILAFIKSCQVDARLDEFSNEEIAHLLLEGVWADMDCTSFRAVIIEQAIERLKETRAMGAKQRAEAIVDRLTPSMVEREPQVLIHWLAKEIQAEVNGALRENPRKIE